MSRVCAAWRSGRPRVRAVRSRRAPDVCRVRARRAPETHDTDTRAHAADRYSPGQIACSCWIWLMRECVCWVCWVCCSLGRAFLLVSCALSLSYNVFYDYVSISHFLCISPCAQTCVVSVSTSTSTLPPSIALHSCAPRVRRASGACVSSATRARIGKRRRRRTCVCQCSPTRAATNGCEFKRKKCVWIVGSV